MDNWLFLFLGLILAYGLEFTRPWVKSYFKNRSLSTRQRRIKGIVDEFSLIKGFRENPSNLIIFLLRYLALLLSTTALMVAVFSFFNFYILNEHVNIPRIIWGIPALILLFMVLITWQTMLRTILAVQGYNQFKAKLIKKLEKLGVDPKDFPEGLADG